MTSSAQDSFRPTTNADRLKAYKAKMKIAGFTRLSMYVHPDLVAYLIA